MPIVYQFDVSLGVLFITAHGVVTDPEYASAYRSFSRDARFVPEIRTLGDFTQITDNHITMEMMRQVSEEMPPHTARRAALVTRQLEYGLSRAYMSFREGNSTDGLRAVFTDRQDCCDWLNTGQPPEKHIR